METDRLYIRKFVEEDIEAFCELIRNKMASPYAVYDHAFPTDDDGLHEVLRYFTSTDEFWALELKAESRVIGFISLNRVDEVSRNLGYCLHTEWHKKGYATEAAQRMIKYAAEELKLKKLVSGTAKENLPSVRLLDRLGFVAIGLESYELALN